MDRFAEGDVQLDGAHIHFYRTGTAGKPAILLLHGVTDNGLCWTRVARDLESEYDVIMTDARGHGKSDRITGEFSIDVLADDAAGVIRELGLQRPYVFGHSMGAITAAVLAARHGDLVRAIVLEDPPIGDDLAPLTFGPEQQQALADLRALPREERLERATREQPGWARDEVVPQSDSKMEFDVEVFRRGGVFRAVPWREVLASITCPVLLVIGDRALGGLVTPATAEEVLQGWTDSEVSHIEGAGHCIHRDRYDETMQRVLAFLRAH